MGTQGKQPKYGPPYQPPSEDGPPDPDKGRDLWPLVPQLEVPAPWNSNPGPPSFNDDLPGKPPKNPTSTPTPECWPIQMNMISIRTGLFTIISELQSAVALYQDVRNAVYVNKDHVFGQDATVSPHVTGVENYVPESDTEPSEIQKSAQDFAASINPAQEKVLEQIANALEVVGQFTAGVDRAGQAYGSADRKAKFPEPPPNPVTKA